MLAPVADANADFPSELASVGQARRFVRQTLSDWGMESVEPEASQLVTELATNCVIHAGTPFQVRLSVDGQVLRLSVSDGSSRAPITKAHSREATTGRGLDLVAAFSDSWGITTRPDGKTVWCTLGVASENGLPTSPSGGGAGPVEMVMSDQPPSRTPRAWGGDEVVLAWAA